MQQLWRLLLGATTKALPDRQVLRLQNAKIPWPPKQLPLSTSCNWDHWCVWQVHHSKRVALQRNLSVCLVTPESASGSTSACPWLWSEETLPANWPVCKFDLIVSALFLLLLMYWPASLPAACPVSMYSYCLPNPHSFYKFHCSLSCAVLPCALVNYLVSCTAYDETTAWCYDPHCLQPPRLCRKS